MRLACVRIRLHSDQRYIRFTHLRKSWVHLASDSGDERSDVDAMSQARRVPSLEINRPKQRKKYITGITTGIEWEKKRRTLQGRRRENS
jgi:hypothetical protein